MMSKEPELLARIGVVGTGGIFLRYHYPVTQMLGDYVKVVAVCDKNEDSARNAGGRCGGVPHYTSFEQMLDKHPDINVVYVTTFGNWHHVLAIRAARRGKHVFMEKPMAISRPTAQAIVDACRDNGVSYEVSENFPFMPRDQVIMAIIKSGLIGEVKRVFLHDPINPFSLDIGVHRLSQFRLPSQSSIARLRGFIQAIPAESFLRGAATLGDRNYCDPLMYHRGHGMAQFANGVVGLFECAPTGHRPSRGAHRCREIVGTQGSVSDNIWPNLHGKMPGNDLVVQVGVGADSRAIPVTRRRHRVNGRLTLAATVVASDPPIVVENRFKAYPMTDWQIASATMQMSIAEAAAMGKPVLYGEEGRRDIEDYFSIVASDEKNSEPVDVPGAGLTKLEGEIHQLFYDRFGFDPLNV